MQEEKKSKSFTFFHNSANILSIKISPLLVTQSYFRYALKQSYVLRTVMLHLVELTRTYTIHFVLKLFEIIYLRS